ncbi:ATP-binding protein [Elusimicrobiota bacterium]
MSTRPAIPREEYTLPLKVKNTGFLLDRLGQDCHPLQFLRELTQNSIESIMRSKRPGEIVWDCDWNTFDLTGNQKLCVVDTGDGMTGDEMIEYINNLSASISQQSMLGNYGVGAKIAAAPRNPQGLIYNSWKDSRGSHIHLWRNPKDGTYGLRQHDLGEGTYAHHVDLSDEIKPPQVKEHGTMVMLMGSSEEQNTMQAPEGTPAASRWLAKYLNTRYFRFPDTVKVQAREGWEFPRQDAKRNKLRTITGQAHYLQNHAEASGEVALSGARARWWILKDTKALSQDSNYYASSGHVAAIFKDELYEMASGRAGTAKLQQFGIIFGCSQVVIYVEPTNGSSQQVTTNTARTQLLIKNEPLPWVDWAAEFRGKMPPEIEALIQSKAAGAEDSDHSKSIRDRLKSILDLFKVSRYRPSPAGTYTLDPDAMMRGGNPRDKAGGTGSSSSSSGGSGGKVGSIYSIFQKKGGPRSSAVNPDMFPEVRWVALADGSRNPGDMEDRAAKFLKEQNLLLINRDFRVFQDMYNRWTKEYRDLAGIEGVVKSVVEGWFEQALVESVIGVQAMEKSKEWSPDNITSALSEEALTATVMQRYHINNQVKRELGAKIGSLKAAPAKS